MRAIDERNDFNPYRSVDMDFSFTKADRNKTFERPHFNFKATRSQLIRQGVLQFSPYMDPDGTFFSPKDRFGATIPTGFGEYTKEQDTREETKFVTHMAAKMPDSMPKPWFVRPHHLKSVTDHPLSMNDEVDLTDFAALQKIQQGSIDPEEPPVVEAVEHIDWVLNDLRGEHKSPEVKRLSQKFYTTRFDEIDKFHGWFQRDKSAFKYKPKAYKADPNKSAYMQKIEELQDLQPALEAKYIQAKQNENIKKNFSSLINKTLSTM